MRLVFLQLWSVAQKRNFTCLIKTSILTFKNRKDMLIVLILEMYVGICGLSRLMPFKFGDLSGSGRVQVRKTFLSLKLSTCFSSVNFMVLPLY